MTGDPCESCTRPTKPRDGRLCATCRQRVARLKRAGQRRSPGAAITPEVSGRVRLALARSDHDWDQLDPATVRSDARTLARVLKHLMGEKT